MSFLKRDPKIQARSASEWSFDHGEPSGWDWYFSIQNFLIGGVFRLTHSLALRACIACLLSILLCQSINAQTSVILSVSNDKKLVVYSLDDAGSLNIEYETKTTGKPGCSIAGRTVPFTRSFNISTDGKRFVAAGQKSNKIRVFAIDDDGKTKLLSTADTGKARCWVHIIHSKADQ